MKPSGGSNVSYSNGVWSSDTPFDDTNIIQDFARGIGSILNDASGVTQQYEHQVEQWQREKEFNDYANDMAHMRAAGLNPDMMYGKGAGVSSTPFPQVGSSAGLPKGELIRSINDMVNQSRLVGSEIQKTEAETDVAKAQAEEIRHRIPRDDERHGWDKITRKFQDDLLQDEIGLNEVRFAEIFNRGLGIALDNFSKGYIPGRHKNDNGTFSYDDAYGQIYYEHLDDVHNIIKQIAQDYDIRDYDLKYLRQMFTAMCEHDLEQFKAASAELRSRSAVTEFKADNKWFQFLDYFISKFSGYANGIVTSYATFQHALLTRKHVSN